jgi:hypothetical protein
MPRIGEPVGMSLPRDMKPEPRRISWLPPRDKEKEPYDPNEYIPPDPAPKIIEWRCYTYRQNSGTKDLSIAYHPVVGLFAYHGKPSHAQGKLSDVPDGTIRTALAKEQLGGVIAVWQAGKKQGTQNLPADVRAMIDKAQTAADIILAVFPPEPPPARKKAPAIKPLPKTRVK